MDGWLDLQCGAYTLGFHLHGLGDTGGRGLEARVAEALGTEDRAVRAASQWVWLGPPSGLVGGGGVFMCSAVQLGFVNCPVCTFSH